MDKVEITNSKNISWYEYDEEMCELVVCFKSNIMYRYENITQEEYNMLQSASSKGSFVRNELGRHKYSTVTH